MSTLGELRGAIARAVKRTDITSDGDSLVSDSSIVYAIKSAIRFYENQQFYFNTKSADPTIVADQSYVDVPSDFISDILWRLTDTSNGRVLSKVPFWEVEQYRAYSTYVTSNTPEVYAVFASRLELYPTPNSALTSSLSYIYQLTELSVDADSNAWTNEGRDMIRNKAMAIIYRETFEDYERAQAYEAQASLDYDRLQEKTFKQDHTGRVAFESYL